MRPSPPSMGTSSFLTSMSTRVYARSVAMTMSWFERSSGMIFETLSSVLRSPDLGFAARRARRRRRGRRAALAAELLHLEDVGQLLRHLGGRRVVNGDDPDLLARPARLVDLPEDLQHAVDVHAAIRDDEGVLRRVRDDVALLALEAREHRRDLVDVAVLDAHEPRDVVLAHGHVRVGAVDRDRRRLRAQRFDDAQELARGLDREAHRVERREEQPVGLLGRDELRRDDRDLLAVGGDRAGQQELAARDRRDPGDEIAELGVGLHVELDDALARRELPAGVELLLTRRPRPYR